MKPLVVFLFLLVLMGCQTELSIAPTPTTLATMEIVTPPTVGVTPSIELATHTPFPTVTALPEPTIAPTSLPLPTEAPLVLQIAVPPEREQVLAQAVELFNAENSRVVLQWVSYADPADAVARGLADGGLVWGNAGIPTAQEPLAIVAPFAYWQESLTGEQAQNPDITRCVSPITAPCSMPFRDVQPPLKVLPIDGVLPHETGYPLQQSWSLVGLDEALAESIVPFLQDAFAHDPLVHMIAVGDVMLDRSLNWHSLALGKLDAPFAEVADVLRAPDITIGNMESALGDVGEPEPKSYTFQAPPVAAEAMARAGFDVMSLANNHALDFGRESLLQGIGLLQAQGIAPIGAGANATEAHAPFVTTVNGISVAFLGYMDVPKEWHGYDNELWTATADTAGVAWGNPDEIRADVTAIKDEVDVVVVVLHSGYEYIEEPSEEQAAAVQAAVDAGAQLVIGHHAHIVQGVGFGSAGQVAAYGLGNFAFDIEGEAGNTMLEVWLDGDGVRMVALMPAIVQYGGYPRLANEQEGRAIRDRIYFLSQFLKLQ